uniref:Uncharacterized protein n=1 Tax=Anguilla anguilla TaxID=7936 RepID=A0A0E9T639_ANGAN
MAILFTILDYNEIDYNGHAVFFSRKIKNKKWVANRK